MPIPNITKGVHMGAHINSQPHPMDEIPVRQLRFNFDDVTNHNPVWSRSSPEFAMFINALGVHVPHFERFLVKVMREYRDELNNPKLTEDVKNIIGQEAHHAFNFLKWNVHLGKRYPGIVALDQHAKDYFAEQLNRPDHSGSLRRVNGRCRSRDPRALGLAPGRRS